MRHRVATSIVLMIFVFFSIFGAVPKVEAQSPPRGKKLKHWGDRAVSSSPVLNDEAKPFCQAIPALLYQNNLPSGKSLILEKCATPSESKVRLRLQDLNLSLEPVDILIDSRTPDTIFLNDYRLNWEKEENGAIIFHIFKGGEEARIRVPRVEKLPSAPNDFFIGPPQQIPMITVDDPSALLAEMKQGILPVMGSVVSGVDILSDLQMNVSSPEMQGPLGCLITLLGWAASWIGFFDSCTNQNAQGGWKAFVCFINSVAIGSGIIGAVAACFGIPF